jgi:hypothetical protein
MNAEQKPLTKLSSWNQPEDFGSTLSLCWLSGNKSALQL